MESQFEVSNRDLMILGPYSIFDLVRLFALVRGVSHAILVSYGVVHKQKQGKFQIKIKKSDLIKNSHKNNFVTMQA